MVLENNTILYFSGTGNSLQVASDLKDQLGDFDLLKITSLRNEENIIVEANITLGIVFPVYFARLPLVVEAIVNKLEVRQNGYVFAVATHGGGPAAVLNKLQQHLYRNGITLSAGFLIHMPGNHIFAYNTRPVEINNRIFSKEKKKIMRISEVVSRKLFMKCETSKLMLDTLIDNLFMATTDKIMENINEGDKNFWVNENCNGCKLCEKICPVKNIEFTTKPVWKHNCQRCTACIQYCPKEAIQWGDKTVKRQRYRNPNIKLKKML